MKFDDRLLAERLHPFADGFVEGVGEGFGFDNWRLWLRHRRGFGHCGSVEWRYEPELLNETLRQEREEKGVLRIYTLPAQWLENLVTSQRPTQRRLLQLWWYGVENAFHVPIQQSAQNCVHRLRRERLMNFPASEFENVLVKATVAVWNPLQQRLKLYKDRAILRGTAGSGPIPDTSTGARPVAASVEKV